MEKKEPGRRVFIRIDDEDEIEQAVDQMLDQLLGEQEERISLRPRPVSLELLRARPEP